MIDCWKCPINTIEKCKENSEYCRRYATPLGESNTPKSKKELEEIRQKEKNYWDMLNS